MVDSTTDKKNEAAQKAAITLHEVLAGAKHIENVEVVERRADYAIWGCTINGVPSSLTWSVTP